MKKNKIFMLLLAVVLGLLIGIQFKSSYQEEMEISYLDSQLITEINKVKSENRQLISKKDELANQLDSLEKNKIKDEKSKKFKDQVDEIKFLLGYKPAAGNGIIIKIDTIEEVVLSEDLGRFMEEKKLLISLINEIKIYGGEAISINEQRITPYSEVTLAGRHININSIPVAPPYEIKVIGDKNRLKNHINKENVLIDMMMDIYKLDVEISDSDNIYIPNVEREKKFKYAKEDIEAKI